MDNKNNNIQYFLRHTINLFVKIMKEINFLGWSGILATAIGIISFIPILYQIAITKNTNNFTKTSLLMALVSNILWIVYGVSGKLFTPTLSGVLYFMIYSFILIYKLFY